MRGITMGHTPIYEIYGQERRKLKNKASKIKSFIKNLSWHVSVNNDLYTIYGESDRVINKEEEAEMLRLAQEDLNAIKEQLNKPYSNDGRNRENSESLG